MKVCSAHFLQGESQYVFSNMQSTAGRIETYRDWNLEFRTTENKNVNASNTMRPEQNGRYFADDIFIPGSPNDNLNKMLPVS